MSDESNATVVAYVVVALFVLWLAVLWKRPRLRTNVTGVAFTTLGMLIAWGVATYWLSEHAYTQSSPCGDAPGTVDATLPLGSYGFGQHKRFIMINLTEIGSAQNIDDDDKLHATMSTFVNGTLQNRYDIGIEIKGTKAGGKWSYSVETQEWDNDDNEWDGDDTEIAEFGFTRQYEDYVIRSQVNSDPAFVIERSNFVAQPLYYEHAMVELLFAFQDKVTYEGDITLSTIRQKENPYRATSN